VVAPHPDDETFGCGGLIARARAAGTEVTVVVVSDGARSTRSARMSPPELAALRRRELHTACARLGVTDLVEWAHPDGALPRPDELAAQLGSVVADRRPHIVLTPCRQDTHPDHVTVHRATRLALGFLSTPPVLLGYPVWTWHAGPFFLGASISDRPRLQAWAIRQIWSRPWWRVPLGRYGDQKRSAIGAYRSQTTNLTGEPGWSRLPRSFVELFLAGDEVFLPLAGRAARTTTAR